MLKRKRSALFISTLLLLFCGFGLGGSGCVGTQTKGTVTEQESPPTEMPAQTQSDPIHELGSMVDPRDGESYATVTIGKQTWLAENLRYEVPGSMLNPENPSKAYGRLYKLLAAQNACPPGWHLPSDAEWDQLEIAHGMPDSFVNRGGWRGEHAPAMRAATGWELEEIEANQHGFNALPAGYYFSGDMGGEQGMQGFGFSAAWWSSRVEDVATARFMFDVRQFVNKWEDKNNETGAGLSCRCVKD